MPIKVLFFGATAEITGKRTMNVELTDSIKAQQVFDKLVGEYASLAAHKLLLTVNQQFATGEEILEDGDELAIFTAVSGG